MEGLLPSAHLFLTQGLEVVRYAVFAKLPDALQPTVGNPSSSTPTKDEVLEAYGKLGSEGTLCAWTTVSGERELWVFEWPRVPVNFSEVATTFSLRIVRGQEVWQASEAPTRVTRMFLEALTHRLERHLVANGFFPFGSFALSSSNEDWKGFRQGEAEGSLAYSFSFFIYGGSVGLQVRVLWKRLRPVSTIDLESADKPVVLTSPRGVPGILLGAVTDPTVAEKEAARWQRAMNVSIDPHATSGRVPFVTVSFEGRNLILPARFVASILPVRPPVEPRVPCDFSSVYTAICERGGYCSDSVVEFMNELGTLLAATRVRAETVPLATPSPNIVALSPLDVLQSGQGGYGRGIESSKSRQLIAPTSGVMAGWGAEEVGGPRPHVPPSGEADVDTMENPSPILPRKRKIEDELFDLGELDLESWTRAYTHDQDTGKLEHVVAPPDMDEGIPPVAAIMPLPSSLSPNPSFAELDRPSSPPKRSLQHASLYHVPTIYRSVTNGTHLAPFKHFAYAPTSLPETRLTNFYSPTLCVPRSQKPCETTATHEPPNHENSAYISLPLTSDGGKSTGESLEGSTSEDNTDGTADPSATTAVATAATAELTVPTSLPIQYPSPEPERRFNKGDAQGARLGWRASLACDQCRNSALQFAMLLEEAVCLGDTELPVEQKGIASTSDAVSSDLLEIVMQQAMTPFDGISITRGNNLLEALALRQCTQERERNTPIDVTYSFLSEFARTEEPSDSALEVAMDPLSEAVTPITATEALQDLVPVISSFFPRQSVLGPLPLSVHREPSETFSTNHRCELAVEELCPPRIVVGYDGNWIESSPSIVRFWEKVLLEPYSPRKTFYYCAICPCHEGMVSLTLALLRELTSIYEGTRLGTHCPLPLMYDKPDSPPIEVATRTNRAGEKGEPSHLRAYGEACRRVAQNIRSVDPYNLDSGGGSDTVNLVVYVIHPFSTPRHVATLYKHLTELMEGNVTPGGLQVMVQMVPLSFVVHCEEALLGLEGHGLTSLKELAFTVFNKLRRTFLNVSFSVSLPGTPFPQTPAPGLGPGGVGTSSLGTPRTPGASGGDDALDHVNHVSSPYTPSISPASLPPVHVFLLGKLFEPLFVLAAASPPPACLLGDLHQSQNPLALQEDVLYCAYLVTDDLQWLIATWTDSRGELLEPHIFSCTEALGGVRVALNRLWDAMVRLSRAHKSKPGLESAPVLCHIVIGRFGSLPSTELTDWMGIFGTSAECSGLVATLPSHSLPMMDTAPSGPSLLTFSSVSLVSLEINRDFQVTLPPHGRREQHDSASPPSILRSSFAHFPEQPIMRASHPARPLGTSVTFTTTTPPPPLEHSFFRPLALEWPTTLELSLFVHYRKEDDPQQKCTLTSAMCHTILRTITTHFHRLSWLTVSPQWPLRESTLPIHFAVLGRLARFVAAVGM